MENGSMMMYYQLKLGFGAFLLLILSSGCLKNDDLNQAFVSYEPKNIGDGLTLSTPDDENMDANALRSMYSEVYMDDNLWSLRSLLVFRNGNLVAESYPKDSEDIITRHIIWSCTKQYLGVLVGLAIQDGIISDVNDPLSDYFDDELINHPDKNDLTIHNLLTMQSGLDFENSGLGSDDDILLRQIPDNSVDYVLGLPLIEEQGLVFNYNDGNPHLLSAIIQKKVGQPTDVWANDVLFSKIEMNNYHWVRYRDGITMGGWGIETTPREMAKLALCVADSGSWKGEQIVDPVWISQMLTPYIPDADLGFSFGYYWWIDEARHIYYMDGHGGQFAFIVPAKDLVIVMTAFPNTQGKYQILADEAMEIVDRIVDISY